MRPRLAALVLPLLLAACGSFRDALPAGIGSGRDELKRSPCSCLEVEPEPDSQFWREDVARQLRRGLAGGALAGTLKRA